MGYFCHYGELEKGKNCENSPISDFDLHICTSLHCKRGDAGDADRALAPADEGHGLAAADAGPVVAAAIAAPTPTSGSRVAQGGEEDGPEALLSESEAQSCVCKAAAVPVASVAAALALAVSLIAGPARPDGHLGAAVILGRAGVVEALSSDTGAVALVPGSSISTSSSNKSSVAAAVEHLNIN